MTQIIDTVDAAAISRILAASWREAYRGMVPQSFLDSLSDDAWTERFQAWFEAKEVSALLLLEDGKPAGTASFLLSGEIRTLYILPEKWRRGYGSKLLKAVCDRLRPVRKDAYVWVLRENERARRFYQDFGFSPNGEDIEFTVGGKVLTDLKYCIQWQ